MSYISSFPAPSRNVYGGVCLTWGGTSRLKVVMLSSAMVSCASCDNQERNFEEQDKNVEVLIQCIKETAWTWVMDDRVFRLESRIFVCLFVAVMLLGIQ